MTKNKLIDLRSIVFSMLVAISWLSSALAEDVPAAHQTDSAAAVAASAQHALALPDASASPAAVVATLEQALLYIMQMPDADTTARAAVLKPVLQRTFDFQRMSRFIFGPRWNDFSTAQQDEFIHALLELSCANYGANFDSYNSEHFVAEETASPEQSTDSARARISRRLVTNKQSVPFNYALTRTEEGWQIANIMAKGVSDLALKRSQYSKLYDNGGVAAVLDHIASQTQRLYSS
jgi:phospholipid transport system substrate-binding protein